MINPVKYMIPFNVIEKISSHLEHAERKHKKFCNAFICPNIGIESIKATLKDCRKGCKDFGTADFVLQEEVMEVLEAYAEGRYRDCREEVYDTIAVLLRMDKILDDKIKSEVSSGLAEAETHSI